MKKFAGIITTITIAAIAAGCGAVSNGGTATPTPTGTATPTPTGTAAATTIADINTGAVSPNTSVTLEHLVVTAVTAQGDFFAQDAGGGVNSGMYFFDKNHHSPVDLAIGDEVTVTGTFSPYQGPTSSPWGAAENEVIPATVTQTGTGLTPVAIDLAAADIGPLFKMTSNVPDHPEYMGALVHITGAQVTSLTMGFGEYAIGATTATRVRIDKGIFDSYEPRLLGETFSDVTGVVAYDFNNYHVNVRSASDLVTTVANTNTVANASAYTSIGALLADTALVSGKIVKISGTGFYVSGLSAYTNNSGNSLKSFFAQDATTGAVNSGMFFDDGKYSNPAVSIGSKVTAVMGKLIIVTTTTGLKIHSIQLGYLDMDPIAITAGTAPTPLTVPIATLSANKGQYEGVLVKVADAGMTVTTATNSFGEFQFGTGTSKFWASDLSMTLPTETASTAVASVQGPVYFAHNNDYLVPQAAGDIQ